MQQTTAAAASQQSQSASASLTNSMVMTKTSQSAQQSNRIYKNIKPVLSPHPRAEMQMQSQQLSALKDSSSSQAMTATKQRTPYKSSGPSPASKNPNPLSSSNHRQATKLNSANSQTGLANSATASQYAQLSPVIKRNRTAVQNHQQPMSSSSGGGGILGSQRKSIQVMNQNSLIRPTQCGGQIATNHQQATSGSKKQASMLQKHKNSVNDLTSSQKTSPRKRAAHHQSTTLIERHNFLTQTNELNENNSQANQFAANQLQSKPSQGQFSNHQTQSMQNDTSNNNVFERLYKTHLQNIRVNQSSQAVAQLQKGGNGNSSYQWFQINDDSSGGMTAHEFHQFLRDQKKSRRSAASTLSAMRNERKNTTGNSSMNRSSPKMRRKKSVAIKAESSNSTTLLQQQASQLHQNSQLSQSQQQLQQSTDRWNQQKSLLDNYNTASSGVTNGKRRQSQGATATSLMLNRRYRRGGEDFEDEDLDDEDSQDLMVVNLTNNTFQQHGNRLPPQDDDNVREMTVDEIKTEGPTMIIDNNHTTLTSVEMAEIQLNESQATCSVTCLVDTAKAPAATFQQQNQMAMAVANKRNQANTPHDKMIYNMHLKEMLEDNFEVNRSHSGQGVVSGGSLSHRNNRRNDGKNSLKAEERNGRYTMNEVITKYEKQMALVDQDESMTSVVEVRSMMSRYESEKTPLRRSRSERKQAWLESASSVCSGMESQNQLHNLQQPLAAQVYGYQPSKPQQSSDLQCFFDSPSKIRNSADLLNQNNQDQKQQLQDSAKNSQVLEDDDKDFGDLCESSPDGREKNNIKREYLTATPQTVKLANLLEPVDEVADEDNNYLSRSPERGIDSDDSQVEIVDPQVQLFDGADGGEQYNEDLLLEGQMHQVMVQDSNDSNDQQKSDGDQGNNEQEDESECDGTTTALVLDQHHQQQMQQQNQESNQHIGTDEEESKKEGQHHSNAGANQSSIEQLYGQISMFDQITEENYYGRGEESDDEDDGEDATRRIKRFRQQIEHLNSDLHDLIYSGEDEESGAEDAIDGFTLRSSAHRNRKVAYKKMGGGKPQNLDLLPSSYSMEDNNAMMVQADQKHSDDLPNSGGPLAYGESQQIVPPSMPAHMIKEVVQVLDDDTYIVQESIFNQRYESEDDEDATSDEGSIDEDDQPDPSNEENEDRQEDDQQQLIQQQQPVMNNQNQNQNNNLSDYQQEVNSDDSFQQENNLDAPGEEVYDDDDESFEQQPDDFNGMGNGANELIQSLMNQEDPMLDDPPQMIGHFAGQEGGNNNFFVANDQQQQPEQMQQQQQQVVADIEQLMVPHQVLVQVPPQPCTDCLIMQEQQADLQEQLYAAQSNLQLMEEKFILIGEQMTKLQNTTNVLETELQKKNVAVENYDKEMTLLKTQNESMMHKLQTVQKMHKGRQSMQKDMLAYQKLVKDQSVCIESLHSTKSDDKKLLRQLQRENQKLKEQVKVQQSQKTNNSSQVGSRNASSMAAAVANPALSSYQQKTLTDSLMTKGQPHHNHHSDSQVDHSALGSQTMAVSQSKTPKKTMMHLQSQSATSAQKQAQQVPQSRSKRTMSMKTQDSAHKFAPATEQASHEEQKMPAAKNGRASRKANQQSQQTVDDQSNTTALETNNLVMKQNSTVQITKQSSQSSWKQVNVKSVNNAAPATQNSATTLSVSRQDSILS